MRALVLAFPEASAPTAFADSYNVAQALRQAGLTETELLRDVTLAQIGEALAGDPGLVYAAGPLPEALRPALTGPDRPAIVLLDDCADPVEAAGAGIATAVGLCDAGGLAARLTGATPADLAGDIAGLLDGAWTAEPPETAALVPPLPRVDDDVVSVLGDATVSVVPAAPVAAVDRVQAVTPSAERIGRLDDDVAIFIAPPTDTQAARPTAAGLPEPSIIVGVIAPTPASFDTVADDLDAEVAGSEITFDGYEARRALRESDPELFETLVDGGAFDPPDVELVVALQTELQRMGCYRAAIDGDWGPGSRASVARYFEQVADADAMSDEATVALYRQIIRRDDVECPAPAVVAAPSRPSTSSGSSTTRAATTQRSTTTRTTTQRSTTQRATTTQRAPTTGTSSGGQRTLQRGRLGGVFR